MKISVSAKDITKPCMSRKIGKEEARVTDELINRIAVY